MSDPKKTTDENIKNTPDEDGWGEGKGVLGESIKKLFAAGISAAFMTEESIRAYLGDIKLPKDVIGGLVSGAMKSKEEFMNKVSNEVVKIISKIDYVKEASRFVEEHKFKINAEVEVVKKEKEKEENK
ncbi:MAG: hypothetical protein SGJ18_03585 [Pseudomonadota bacterium]|nr:hypothetical protein [Pseudomonadota bacterium]